VTGRALLEAVFREAVAECNGARLVEASLRAWPLGAGPLVVLGAGKAAVAMARGLAVVAGDRIQSGRITTKDEAGSTELLRLDVVAAGHPAPDERSVDAAEDALARAARVGPRERLVVLLAGGASSLWCAPADGLTLAEKREACRAVAASGADIASLNTLRRHLSRIKDGRLAAAAAAASAIDVLVLSDVIGGGLEVVGSGPCSADLSSRDDALAIASAASEGGVAFPAAVLRFLSHGGAHDEAPKCPPRPIQLRSVGDHSALRAAAARAVGRRGMNLQELALISACARVIAGLPGLGPGIYIGGGEPTVRVQGAGKGGRAQHLALLVARLLRGSERVFLCAGSDGSDGPTDAAGAVVDGQTWNQAEGRGLDPQGALDRCDSYRVHDALGTLVRTGPTGTNLCDLHLLLG
jgi:hydroxypyruvate reductase